MNKIVVLLAIMVLLSACSSSPATIPSPTILTPEQLTATPLLTNTATSTTEPISTPTLNQTAGLGLTRADAARTYQLLEFSFELETNEHGQEVYIGTISDELATVTLIGTEDNISSTSVDIRVPKPPTEKQSSRTIVYLTTLLTVAANDWAEGTGWLNESLNKIGESRTSFDNRDIVLIITPEDNQTTVEFTISAK